MILLGKQLKHVYVREHLWFRKIVYSQPQTCFVLCLTNKSSM